MSKVLFTEPAEYDLVSIEDYSPLGSSPLGSDPIVDY